jgi:hypothetical protein
MTCSRDVNTTFPIATIPACLIVSRSPRKPVGRFHHPAQGSRECRDKARRSPSWARTRRFRSCACYDFFGIDLLAGLVGRRNRRLTATAPRHTAMLRRSRLRWQHSRKAGGESKLKHSVRVLLETERDEMLAVSAVGRMARQSGALSPFHWNPHCGTGLLALASYRFLR